MGGRLGLASSAAHLVVQRWSIGEHWIDDAVEQLSGMMYACTLSVVRDDPDGIAESSVAFLLGITEQVINAETRSALIKFRARLKELALESEDL